MQSNRKPVSGPSSLSTMMIEGKRVLWEDTTPVEEGDDISNMLAQDHIAPDGSIVLIVFRKIPDTAPGFLRFYFEEQVVPEVPDLIPLKFWREALESTPNFEEALKRYETVSEQIKAADKQKLLQQLRDGDPQSVEKLKGLQYLMIFKKTVEKVHLGRDIRVTLLSSTEAGDKSKQVLL